jgi:hypothetical protein
LATWYFGHTPEHQNLYTIGSRYLSPISSFQMTPPGR